MFALTIDIDGPQEYAAIHDVAANINDVLVMYRQPLRRFMRMCNGLGIPATCFIIGRDIHSEAIDVLLELAEEGFELACHSSDHNYRLSTCSTEYMEDDLRRARRKMAAKLGVESKGFRAPGYHLSPALLDQVAAQGFRYDSSVMASKAYFAAKAAVLLSYRLRGKESLSFLGSPRLTQAPTVPYRPGLDPYSRGNRELIEIPISVATPLEIPITGATLALAGNFLRRRLSTALEGKSPIVVNFHALDFLDPSVDDFPEELSRLQPELRVPIGLRIARFRQFVAELMPRHQGKTLAHIAAEWNQKL